MTRTAFRATAAGIAIAALALTGCSASSEPSTSADPSDAAPSDAATEESGELLASVDTMFGTIDIPVPADGELTVVALGWSDAETALALGVKPVAVYDWLSYGEEGKAVGPWAADLWGDESPTVLPRVDGDLDYELIQSLEPDLILNVRSANDEAQFERLSTIAPTVYGPEGAPAYATPWRDHTEMIAEALGKADEGEAMVAEVDSQISDAAAAHPEFADKTAVSGSKFGDAYGANLSGDFRWDLLEEVGFTMNPPVLDLEASGFYANVSLEQVSVFDADVAVLMPIGYTLDELKADPLLASLDVVKDGRAVLLDGAADLANAFSAASIVSIPVAVEELVPLLAEAASK